MAIAKALTNHDKNKKLLLDKLGYYEIKKVVVDFSGSGDSGSLGDITVYPLDEETETTAEALGDIFVPAAVMSPEIDWSTSPPTERDWKKNPASLKDLLEEVCYQELETGYAGWEINGGTSGSITFVPLAAQFSPNKKQISVAIEFHEDEDDDYDYESEGYNDE